MVTNVQITQKDGENALGVLRRFRSRIKTSGVLQRSRSLRYHGRKASKFNRKKSRLTMITRADERARLIKLGKLGE